MEKKDPRDNIIKAIFAILIGFMIASSLVSCVVPCGTTELVRRDGFGRIYEIQVIDDCSGLILRRIYYDATGNITGSDIGEIEGSKTDES